MQKKPEQKSAFVSPLPIFPKKQANSGLEQHGTETAKCVCPVVVLYS
jgi:hypothetical protein